MDDNSNAAQPRRESLYLNNERTTKDFNVDKLIKDIASSNEIIRDQISFYEKSRTIDKDCPGQDAIAKIQSWPESSKFIKISSNRFIRTRIDSDAVAFCKRNGKTWRWIDDQPLSMFTNSTYGEWWWFSMPNRRVKLDKQLRNNEAMLKWLYNPGKKLKSERLAVVHHMPDDHVFSYSAYVVSTKLWEVCPKCTAILGRHITMERHQKNISCIRSSYRSVVPAGHQQTRETSVINAVLKGELSGTVAMVKPAVFISPVMQDVIRMYYKTDIKGITLPEYIRSCLGSVQDV